MKYPLSTLVNGREVRGAVEARTLLSEFLREHIGLRSVRVGCDSSVCGSCTVLLDGRTVKSCTVLAVQADGRRIATIEGLEAEAGTGAEGSFESVRAFRGALRDRHALQCGYCTPGMIISASALLEEGTRPERADPADGLAGNLCRCGVYSRLREALDAALRKPDRRE